MDAPAVECSICYDSLTKGTPKILRCGHSFCLQCVTKLKKGYKISCPKCRKKTKLSHGDVGILATNYDLLDIGNIPVSNTSNCESCGKKHVTKKASHTCVQCFRKLCPACVEEHQKLPWLSSHVMIHMGNERVGTCLRHNVQISLICMECSCILCMECSKENKHELHTESIMDYHTAINMLRDDLEMTNKNMIELKTRHASGCEALKRELFKIEQNHLAVDTMRDQWMIDHLEGPNVITHICEVNIIEDTFILHEMEIRNRYDEMCNNKTMLETYEREITELLGKSDTEVVTHGKRNCEAAGKLVMKTREHLSKSYSVPKFVPSDNPAESVGKVDIEECYLEVEETTGKDEFQETSEGPNGIDVTKRIPVSITGPKVLTPMITQDQGLPLE